MSFILDALRKSESERQQQQAAEFATVPSGATATAAPRWLWLVGSLLVLNLVVLAVFLFRGGADGTAATDPAGREHSRPAETRAGGPDGTPAQPPEATASFSERLADVRESRPDADAAPAGSAARGGSTASSRDPAAPARDAGRAAPAPPRPGVATVPSLEQLQLEGAVDLPPLHLDLHVYNEAAGRRFVSINMQKYRENERLREGPLVREITREGVVLEHDGQLFALVQ